GVGDGSGTGVQTCGLPIPRRSARSLLTCSRIAANSTNAASSPVRRIQAPSRLRLAYPPSSAPSASSSSGRSNAVARQGRPVVSGDRKSGGEGERGGAEGGG